jgi:hypothetical protein
MPFVPTRNRFITALQIAKSVKKQHKNATKRIAL